MEWNKLGSSIRNSTYPVFRNCINPLCTCSLEVESTPHFLLHCHHYHNIRAKLFNSLQVIDKNLFKLSE